MHFFSKSIMSRSFASFNICSRKSRDNSQKLEWNSRVIFPRQTRVLDTSRERYDDHDDDDDDPKKSYMRCFHRSRPRIKGNNINENNEDSRRVKEDHYTIIVIVMTIFHLVIMKMILSWGHSKIETKKKSTNRMHWNKSHFDISISFCCRQFCRQFQCSLPSFFASILFSRIEMKG